MYIKDSITGITWKSIQMLNAAEGTHIASHRDGSHLSVIAVEGDVVLHVAHGLDLATYAEIARRQSCGSAAA